MLNIQLDEIKEKGLLLEGEISPDSLPQLVAMVADGDASFPVPVAYRLNLSRLADLVEVSGHVESVLELTCGRCLEPYQMPFSSDFYLAYTEKLPECVEEEDEETELSAEDMGLTLIEDEKISLLEPLQEQLLMAMPIQPLCQRDCRGLCLYCGCNLNEQDCTCVEASFDTRFASLKNFKVNKNN